MKKIFVIITSILSCLFFIFVVRLWGDVYVSRFYPNVSAFSVSDKTTYENVKDALTKLADETDSIVAMQQQIPGDDGVPKVTYVPFGKGKLPKGLVEQRITDTKNVGLLNNYFIFGGKLKVEDLKAELTKIGFLKLDELNVSQLDNISLVFSPGFQSISLVVFLITFGALSLISQIRLLKYSGIRLISGEKRWLIFLRPFKQDIFNSLLGVIAGLIFSLIVRQFIEFPLVAFSTLATCLIVYNALLLLISFIFASIFAVGIKKIKLMQVIKGKIPVNGVISLILIAQLLSIIVIAVSFHHAVTYSKVILQIDNGRAAWQEEKKWTTMLSARGHLDDNLSEEKIIYKKKMFFNFLNQEISEDKALLCTNNLVVKAHRNGLRSKEELSSSTIWDDYSEQGNVLIVSPLYLKRQKIKVSAEVNDKIEKLKTGEFVLLLPEKLKSEENKYKETFEKSLTKRVNTEQNKVSMSATIISYLENGHDRFVYNTTPISFQQFLRDPIIIVLTPLSTGEQSYNFWEDISGSILYDNVAYTQSVLKKYHIENWAAEFQTGYSINKNFSEKAHQTAYNLFAAAVMAIMTSMLMFNIMNKLYFEEFRRDIFIKRISGCSFFEVHRKYLLSQLLVFIIGFVVSFVITGDIIVDFSVLLLFIIICILELKLQMNKENKMSTIILKGA